MIIEFIIGLFIAYGVYKTLRRRRCNPQYNGKTVWITGASSGIGEALAYQFNEKGADLIISARNLEQLERVKSACKYPERVKVIKLDITNFDTVKAVTDYITSELQARGKGVDVVVENAGVSMRCQFKDYSFQNHLHLFNVNVNGPYYHLQCLMNHMISRRKGQIVGITSVTGKLATRYRTSYSGSKHAMVGILDSLRADVQPYGIKVTNILPGYVATNISKNALGAAEGQKFGETDKNIQNGMNPAKFAKIAVKAIYLGQNQLIISEKLNASIGVFMRNLCPDLTFYGLQIYGKNQSKAEMKKQ